MRGHDDIIRMRRKGEAPSIVHIETDEGFDRFGSGIREPFGPEQPQVHIAPTETVRRLDMRFIVGLFVQVRGLDAERVASVVEACIKARADRVLGIVCKSVGEGEFRQFPVVSVTDTKGVMAWHE